MQRPESDMQLLLILRHLRNIKTQLTQLDEKMDTLEKKVVMLGAANSQAYSQTKEVISELASNQKAIEMDLSDAMGTIREETWRG